MKTNLIKSLTLLLFISLISSFVAYRAGYFGERGIAFPMSPNGGVISGTEPDSIPVLDSIPPRPKIMPSSKSMIVTDDISLEDLPNKKKPPRTMSSSKSGLIVEPNVVEPKAKKWWQFWKSNKEDQ